MEQKLTVKVDGKKLQTVKTFVNGRELKQAEKAREIYKAFGELQIEAITSLGGTFDEDGKAKGFATQDLNAWRIEQFPALTVEKDGKAVLKDSAFFSHAIRFANNFDAIVKWAIESGNGHKYRPDVLVKGWSKAMADREKAAAVANETPDETADRTERENREKADRLIQGITGPLATLQKMAGDNELTAEQQLKLADLLTSCYNNLDREIRETVYTQQQEKAAAEHAEIRDAELRKVA